MSAPSTRADVAGSSTIDIDCLHAEVLVASDHPAPDSVATRLRETAARHLEGALRSIFTPLLSDSDTGIWLVRRLDVDVHVNLAAAGESVTRSWAAQIARALTPILRGTGDGVNVLWFPDRAAYLARFLTESAVGAAHGRWYFEEFAGLSALPMSATIRTAICDDPELGLLALARIGDDELERVVRALTEHDAQIVLDAIATVQRGSSEAVGAAWRAWRRLGSAGVIGGEWQCALRIFVNAVSHDSQVGGTALSDAALAVARSAGGGEHVFTGSPSASRSSTDDKLTAQLEKLLRMETPLAEEVAERFTEFGGAFLLLPILAEMPLAEATEAWPDPDQCAAISIIRLLALAKCFGPERALCALGDPLLQELLLIPREFDADTAADWCARVGPADLKRFHATMRVWAAERDAARRPSQTDSDYFRLNSESRITPGVEHAATRTALLALRVFGERLRGFADSTPRHLHANFLDCTATLRDEPERRVVRLSRPPLHLVLSMAGLTRSEYRLSWLGDRPFVLFEEA